MTQIGGDKGGMRMDMRKCKNCGRLDEDHFHFRDCNIFEPKTSVIPWTHEDYALKYAKLEDEITRLRAALKKMTRAFEDYGDHAIHCYLRIFNKPEPDKDFCCCGFDQVRSEGTEVGK